MVDRVAKEMLDDGWDPDYVDDAIGEFIGSTGVQDELDKLPDNLSDKAYEYVTKKVKAKIKGKHSGDR